MNPFKRMMTFWPFPVVFCLLFTFTGTEAVCQAQENNKSHRVLKAKLKREAAISLWRLKRKIEKEGYYSSKVALNIWRSNALSAGSFEQAQYDAFLKQIYEKSIDNSLRCFETSVLNEYYNDAGKCLHTWKIHSIALGIFDENQFREMEIRLKSSKQAQSQ